MQLPSIHNTDNLITILIRRGFYPFPPTHFSITIITIVERSSPFPPNSSRSHPRATIITTAIIITTSPWHRPRQQALHDDAKVRGQAIRCLLREAPRQRVLILPINSRTLRSIFTSPYCQAILMTLGTPGALGLALASGSQDRTARRPSGGHYPACNCICAYVWI